jgi:ankyrin repeat protein
MVVHPPTLHLHAVRQHTKKDDIPALEAAIARIPHDQLRPSPWQKCLENIIDEFENHPEKDRLLGLLLSHGGQANHADRRLLLDNVIKEVGKLEIEYEEFDVAVEHSYIIAKMILTTFPEFAWSQARGNNRTVFHVAAETGACRIVQLAETVIVASNRSVSSVIRQGEKNAKTALEIAVDMERTAVVVELLRLDEGQLDFHPNAERIVTTAIEQGPVDIVKALLNDRPQIVTEDMFRKAIASGSIDILRFLIRLRLDILEKSTLLHFAVKRGQIRIVEELIQRWPELAEKYETDIPNDALRSVLYNNTMPEAKEEIRKLIVPVIIERNPVSVIRDILADSSGENLLSYYYNLGG